MDEKLVDIPTLKAAIEQVDHLPDGWKVVDTTPSGLHRLLPEDYAGEYRKVSLPHNRTRTQANFSARFWIAVGIAFIVWCFAAAVWIGYK